MCGLREGDGVGCLGRMGRLMGHDDADGLDEGWDAMAKLRSRRHTSRKLCEPFAGGLILRAAGDDTG
jgi:hypothetical protein